MSSSLVLLSLRLIFWNRTKSALGPPKCPATDHRQRQLETMCNVRPSVRQLNWATAGQVITQRRQQRCKLELNYSISWIRRWIPHSASLALELRLRLRLQLPTKMEPRQAGRQAGSPAVRQLGSFSCSCSASTIEAIISNIMSAYLRIRNMTQITHIYLPLVLSTHEVS